VGFLSIFCIFLVYREKKLKMLIDPFGDILAMLEEYIGSGEEVGGALLMGAWLYLALVLGPSLLSAAPYGKFSGSAATPTFLRAFLGWQMSAKLGWMLQEMTLRLLFLYSVVIHTVHSYVLISVVDPDPHRSGTFCPDPSG
jgi:hypothetical protein